MGAESILAWAEDEVLPLLLRETPRPTYERPGAMEIAGVVFNDANGDGVRDPAELGVAGVSVSDGYRVVKTDQEGRYYLRPSSSAVFVQLTKPSGYTISGDWYKPLSPVVDFSVRRAVEPEEAYTFIHVTDTHTTLGRRDSLAGLSAFVREANSFGPPPRFVVNSGDLLNLHKALTSSHEEGRDAFRAYVGIMNHLAMPYYNVAGDHTDSSYQLDSMPRGDHRAGKALYWEFLGPHYFSFEYGRIHFVSVDYGYHLGRRQLWVNGRQLEYPTNEVQPMHVTWMREDMSARSAGTFVVTTSENDLYRFCPDFVSIAAENDIRLQLTGDDHIVAFKERPVPYRSAGALAGCWWNPKTEGLCPDLSPQGYMIYQVKGDAMDAFYKGLGRRVEIVSHRYGAIFRGRVVLRAHIVQPEPGEGLEYSLDGELWMPMKEDGRPFYRSLHSAEVDSAALADGIATLAVRNTRRNEIRSQPVVIVNGTPLPTGEPSAKLTFAVGESGGTALGRDPDTVRVPAGDVTVLFNGTPVGMIAATRSGEFAFAIAASHLRQANVLSFSFAQSGDGMNLLRPRLELGGAHILDPRDTALRRIRVAQWGADSADWGAFNVGDGDLAEGPFLRKQDEFCFVVEPSGP